MKLRRLKCSKCLKKMHYTFSGLSWCIKCNNLVPISKMKYKEVFHQVSKDQFDKILKLAKQIDLEGGQSISFLFLLKKREYLAKKFLSNIYGGIEDIEEWLSLSYTLFFLSKCNKSAGINPNIITVNETKDLVKMCISFFDCYRNSLLVDWKEWTPYRSDDRLFVLSTKLSPLGVLKKHLKLKTTEFNKIPVNIDEGYEFKSDITSIAENLNIPIIESFFLSVQDPQDLELYLSLITRKCLRRSGFPTLNTKNLRNLLINLHNKGVEILGKINFDKNDLAFYNTKERERSLGLYKTFLGNFFKYNKRASKILGILELQEEMIVIGRYSQIIRNRIFLSSLIHPFVLRSFSEMVEDLIIYFLRNLDLNTRLPWNNEEGLRVRFPNKKGKELADVLVYSRNWIIIVEVKQWLVVEEFRLLNEISKFVNRVKLFDKDKIKLQFPSTAVVLPIMYCPYSPWKERSGVKIVNSPWEMLSYLQLKGIPRRQLPKEHISLPISFNDFDKGEIETAICERFVKDATDKAKRLGVILEDGMYVVIGEGILEKIDFENKEIDVLGYNARGETNKVFIKIPRDFKDQFTKGEMTQGNRIRMLLLQFPGGIRFDLQDIKVLEGYAKCLLGVNKCPFPQVIQKEYCKYCKNNKNFMDGLSDENHKMDLALTKIFPVLHSKYTFGYFSFSYMISHFPPRIWKKIDLETREILFEEYPLFQFVNRKDPEIEFLVVPIRDSDNMISARIYCLSKTSEEDQLLINEVSQAIWVYIIQECGPSPSYDPEGFTESLSELTGVDLLE